jgi:actin-like ATPase involved in cell morphogenesis
MPYALGIDLGSGHLTAAICRNDHERWSEPEVLVLDGSPVTEAVLHLTGEGTVEVGARALRQVVSRPDHVTRGFVDRVGDEIPIILGGRPYPAEVLIAAVVGWIADYAEAAEGAPPARLVVAHPAGWGGHRRAALLGALREAGLPDLMLLPRPVAAAESYTASEPVEIGQEIAVHSLGSGRFEAAVLRRESFGFDVRSHGQSMDTTGGDLFDDLLATRVLDELGGDVGPVAKAKLRAACKSAKERLSTELAVTVPAPRESPRGTVMVNRTDLEELIRPAVEATVSSLQRTILAAGATTNTLRAVVLVGGCGRIPLVTELVTAGVRVRVTAAAEPELSVARGAALAAARVARPAVETPSSPSVPAHKPEPVARRAAAELQPAELPEEDLADIGPPPPRPPVEITPIEPPRRRLLRLPTRGGGEEDDLPPRRERELDDSREFADLDREPAHTGEYRRHREPAAAGERRRTAADLLRSERRVWESGEFDIDVPRRRRAEDARDHSWPSGETPRTDDRAFNESLRGDYVDGEYEVADEPRRGREAR